MVWFAGSLLAGLLALRARALLAAGLTRALIALLAWGGWYAFSVQHLLLNAIAPVMAIGFTFVVCSLLHNFSRVMFGQTFIALPSE